MNFTWKIRLTDAHMHILVTGLFVRHNCSKKLDNKQVCSATEKSQKPDDSDRENEGIMLKTGQQQ